MLVFAGIFFSFLCGVQSSHDTSRHEWEPKFDSFHWRHYCCSGMLGWERQKQEEMKIVSFYLLNGGKVVLVREAWRQRIVCSINNNDTVVTTWRGYVKGDKEAGNANCFTHRCKFKIWTVRQMFCYIWLRLDEFGIIYRTEYSLCGVYANLKIYYHFSSRTLIVLASKCTQNNPPKTPRYMPKPPGPGYFESEIYHANQREF